ncbi:MAG: phosphocholine cytidylyltransferase family protein [Deltaproteobacteria bacterium]|nr:phosphocholine cytidylyltransferase family protein [Deltaproteobacteria bacterium]
MNKQPIAIIMAAGMSRRMRPVTSTPKALLPIAGKPLIVHQLESLWAAGVSETAIITGYKEGEIYSCLSNYPLKCAVQFISNPEYETKNNLYSLSLAGEHLSSPFMIVNCDLIFDYRLIERILGLGRSGIAYQGKSCGLEEMKVTISGEKVTKIGKEISPEKAQGEAVGVTFFKDKLPLFIDRLNELSADSSYSNAFYEASFDRYLEQGEMFAADSSDLPVMEIDTPEDYDVAIKEIAPRLMLKESTQ